MDTAACCLPPAPWYSVLMDGCLEQGKDLSRGLKYNNFGIHGACSAGAADALAAVDKLVLREGCVERSELLNALITNFENDEPLRRRLADEAPKVGNNDDEARRHARQIVRHACRRVRGHRRQRPRRHRSARHGLGYVLCVVGHRARGNARTEGRRDSRRDAAPATILARTWLLRTALPSGGPLSVLQSFAKLDYRRICNGGPITLELSDSVFRGDESIRKVALLIRTFAQLGCQQLQLNTVNVETLRDAKRHPEQHKNLIVRVWGWSGYFCELDEPYQDHVIAPTYV